MKKRIFSYILILFIFFTYSHIIAQDAISSAGAFLRIAPGARPIAMGKSYVAVSDDVMGTYWNPAGTAFLKGTQVGVFYQPMLLDLTYTYATFVKKFGFLGSIGASMISLTSAEIEGRDEIGNLTNPFVDSESAFMFSYGFPASKNLSFGFNGKYIIHSLEAHKGTGMGFDIGLQYRPVSFLSLGVKGQDVFSSITWDTDSNREEKIPMVITSGIAINANRITITGDYEMLSGQKGVFHIGGELRILKGLGLRLGYDEGSFTFGCYLNTGMPLRGSSLKSDYCYSLDKISGDPLFGFSVAFALSKAERPNRPPIAIAGENTSGNKKQVVNLEGVGNDKDKKDTDLNYLWEQISGSNVFFNKTSPETSFIPEKYGTYIFELVVNDGKDDSEPSLVLIEVEEADAIIKEHFSFGNSSQQWNNPHNNNTECIVIEDSTKSEVGSYVGHFINSGQSIYETATTGNSLNDYSVLVKIFMENPWNGDLMYRGIAVRAENPTGSFQQNQTVKCYRYAFYRGGEQIKLEYFTDTWHEIKTFNMRDDYEILKPGWHTLKLTVVGNEFYPFLDNMIMPGSPYVDENNSISSGYAGVHQYLKTGNTINSMKFDDFIVIPANHPPIADAGADTMVYANEVITLQGSGSDEEGSFLSYSWKQISGPDIILSDDSAPTPSFKPTKSGLYEFELTVNDGIDNSVPSEITILMRNVPRKNQ